MIKPIALANGHYECRSLKQTVPILTDVLALEVVDEKAGEVTLKHPNTDWLLIFHEGGRNSPDKPLRNHYGVRVATNAEIEKADAYLEKMKEQYQIEIMKPRNHHFARSVHFFEPGGNWWEIESYELAVKAGMGENVLPHWKSLLAEEKFPGRGYVPQALSHGTIECYDLDRSRQFYRECSASTSWRRRPVPNRTMSNIRQLPGISSACRFPRARRKFSVAISVSRWRWNPLGRWRTRTAG